MSTRTEQNNVAAIEENLYSWIPVFSQLGQTYADNPVGVKRSITQYPIALFNSIMETHLEPEQIHPAVQCVITDAKAHHVPILWWVTSSTQPKDLGKYLLEYGFQLDDDDPGMAVELENLNETLPRLDGLSIQIANSDADWLQWSRAMFAGFEVPSPDEGKIDAWRILLHKADPKSLIAYTGFLENKPVATSLLFMAANAAGIYAVATIPDARRKGIGAWMTLYPLLQARSKGFKIGTLFASPLGEGVYRSLGFREYCRIASYRWAPD